MPRAFQSSPRETSQAQPRLAAAPLLFGQGRHIPRPGSRIHSPRDRRVRPDAHQGQSTRLGPLTAPLTAPGAAAARRQKQAESGHVSPGRRRGPAHGSEPGTGPPTSAPGGGQAFSGQHCGPTTASPGPPAPHRIPPAAGRSRGTGSAEQGRAVTSPRSCRLSVRPPERDRAGGPD